jgi:osmotically inducible lipoprotein OsmB
MSRLVIVFASLSILAACGDTTLSRTASGAAIGAGAAAVTGNDVGTGAVVGGGVGLASDLVR